MTLQRLNAKSNINARLFNEMTKRDQFASKSVSN